MGQPQGFTYSGNPGYSGLDAVRFYVGDTDSTDPLLLDGEITYLLQLYNGAVINASIRACEMIMAKFARMANEAVGGVRIDFNQKFQTYLKMKATLIQRLSTENIRPYCGGISISDMREVAQNTDRPPTDFTKHMMENQQIAPWTTMPNALFGDQIWWD